MRAEPGDYIEFRRYPSFDRNLAPHIRSGRVKFVSGMTYKVGQEYVEERDIVYVAPSEPLLRRPEW